MGDAAGAASPEGGNLAAFAERVRLCAPDLPIHSLRLNPDGLTNHVVMVNEEWVFRFPKDAYAQGLLAREMQTLAVVRNHVDLATPHCAPCSDGVRYRMLPGQPLYRHDILHQDEATQQRLAGQLAHFLRQLHAIPAKVLPHLAPVAPAEVDPQQRWRERCDEIRREVYPHLWADQRDWVEQLFAPVLDGSLSLAGVVPALTHNDLASYHILWRPHARVLLGVIDFGVAQLGDPADDIGILINTYGESFVQRMAPQYPLDQAMLDRARFKAGAVEIEWALKGVRSQDFSWFLVHIGRARDVQPIHIRSSATLNDIAG